jgi:hypothetical protein
VAKIAFVFWICGISSTFALLLVKIIEQQLLLLSNLGQQRRETGSKSFN